MVYLHSFHFPSGIEEEKFFNVNSKTFKTKNYRTCYVSKYPFGMFQYRGLPDTFEFNDITIFCGNNGSGKSTILNVIAETLRVNRNTQFNKTVFFEDYTELCSFNLAEPLSLNSSIITSDDVFEKILDIRRINDGIDEKRTDLLKEWVENRSDDADTRFHGLDDYDRWKKVMDSRNKKTSQSQFLRSNLKRNIEERSNGESALYPYYLI